MRQKNGPRFRGALKVLPESDASQNDSGLFIEFPFGYVNAAKGEKELLLADEAEARRAARVKAPRPPSAQVYLKQALAFQARLEADKALKRADLAREARITPTRLTQLLRLLGLSAEIQKAVLALPGSTGRGLLERELRELAKEPNPKRQWAHFQRLLEVK